MAVDAFISYSHKDDAHREQLVIHLATLRDDGLLRAWDDRRIRPGDDWQARIDEALATAGVILLLVSPDFLASEHCKAEMKAALERPDAVVIPIILRPSDWQTTPIARLQGLPRDFRPNHRVGRPRQSLARRRQRPAPPALLSPSGNAGPALSLDGHTPRRLRPPLRARHPARRPRPSRRHRRHLYRTQGGRRLRQDDASPRPCATTTPSALRSPTASCGSRWAPGSARAAGSAGCST